MSCPLGPGRGKESGLAITAGSRFRGTASHAGRQGQQSVRGALWKSTGRPGERVSSRWGVVRGGPERRRCSCRAVDTGRLRSGSGSGMFLWCSLGRKRHPKREDSGKAGCLQSRRTPGWGPSLARSLSPPLNVAPPPEVRLLPASPWDQGLPPQSCQNPHPRWVAGLHLLASGPDAAPPGARPPSRHLSWSQVFCPWGRCAVLPELCPWGLRGRWARGLGSRPRPSWFAEQAPLAIPWRPRLPCQSCHCGFISERRLNCLPPACWPVICPWPGTPTLGTFPRVL